MRVSLDEAWHLKSCPVLGTAPLGSKDAQIPTKFSNWGSHIQMAGFRPLVIWYLPLKRNKKISDYQQIAKSFHSHGFTQ